MDNTIPPPPKMLKSDLFFLLIDEALIFLAFHTYRTMFFFNRMQVIKSSTQNEQNNLALENELRAELLMYKKQCLESSNKILSLERIFAESFNEK